MSLITKPKRKKHFTKIIQRPPLPIKEDNTKFTGKFNDFSVIIENESEINELLTMGCFGKANLSRTYPRMTSKSHTQIIRRRVYLTRKKWSEISKNKPKKVIVISDSEDEFDAREESHYNLNPKYELDHSGLTEKLHLNLEEAFFLSSALEVLEIDYNDRVLENDEAWAIFKTTDRFFMENYMVYHYFRAKNWIVKPGIKFGGDFLLYKQGPQFYHASYVVIIDVVDSKFQRISSLQRRSMDIVTLMSLNRLCETAAKDLMIVQVVYPEDSSTISYKNLDKIHIKEVVMKRWIASQKREGDNE